MKFFSLFKSLERSSAIVYDFRINPLADEGTLAEISYFDGLHRKQFARICIELLLVYC